MNRTIRLIQKFLTSQPEKQTMKIHILPNISKSKGNQTIHFGRLIDNDMRNIFFENSTTRCYGETSRRHFSEISKLSIYIMINNFNVLCSLFFLYAKLRKLKYIEIK